jgi:DNA-binding GntR family transcriptional regulator
VTFRNDCACPKWTKPHRDEHADASVSPVSANVATNGDSATKAGSSMRPRGAAPAAAGTQTGAFRDIVSQPAISPARRQEDCVVKDKVSGLTLASSVYEAIRRDIIEGRYDPGEKLQSESLREHYGVGISPVREALSRLHSEGWVVREEQRGFRVAKISRDELLELVRTRVLLEGLAVREAIARADSSAEEALVLAFHRLGKEPRFMPNANNARNLQWERRHREFHAALVAGCGLKWIIQYCGQLFDVAERYRLLAATKYPERKEKDEHREILEAYLAADAPRVQMLLAAHYQTTVDIIIKARFGA